MRSCRVRGAAWAAAALLACGCAGGARTPPPAGPAPEDARAIEAVIRDRVTRARMAWERKEPTLLVAGPDSGVLGYRPDGRPITNAESRADLARRMAIVVRLDTLEEVVTGLRQEGDSVEVTTRQRFVRMVRVEGVDRVRVSGVTHRQWFRKVEGRWTSVSPLRESDSEAWWADERPAPPERR